MLPLTPSLLGKLNDGNIEIGFFDHAARKDALRPYPIIAQLHYDDKDKEQELTSEYKERGIGQTMLFD
tara:strand:- start:549 stop:752 length:204 start_codon:yes stop_codon:yes gene_type:complete